MEGDDLRVPCSDQVAARTEVQTQGGTVEVVAEEQGAWEHDAFLAF